MPLPMERTNKALAFLQNELEVPDDFSAKDREFVALLLKNNQNLARCADDMGVSYTAVRRRVKDPGVAKLLNEVLADWNELVRYSLPRVFGQVVTNATLDPRPLMKAALRGSAEFEAAIDALSVEEAAAIQDWGFDREGKPFVKLANKVQSLDLALRFFDQQREQVKDHTRESLGIQVILRAPDGSTTEVRALATPEQPVTVVESDGLG